jgi:outer membrane protein assembly factor BamB
VAQLPVAVFDENRTVSARIANAEQQIADDQAMDAVGFLQQIIRTDGDTLARISRHRHVSVRQLCQNVIRRLNDENLKRYRTEIDRTANQWLSRARAGEVNQFRRILFERPNSTAADESLLKLGQLAWRDDEPGLAYEYWRRLLPRKRPSELQYSGSVVPPAEIAARLVLCRLAMGDTAFAWRELDVFVKEFPTERGAISGKVGVLSELLREEAASDRWNKSEASKPATVWRQVWSRRLGHRIFPREIDSKLHPSFREQSVLAATPAMDGTGVFFSDGQSLFALHTHNGFNLWTGEPDTVVLQENQPLRVAQAVGVPHFEPVLADGRLLVRLGSPVTSHGGRRIDAATSNAVVCVDVKRRQGKVLWRVVASELVEQSEFESPPVAWGDRCFIVVRTSPPKSSLSLVCLNLEHGTVLWKRQLCGGLDEPPESASKVTSVRPVVSSQHVIVPTDNGVIFALTHGGRMQWARTYDRVEPATGLFVGQSAVAEHGFVYAAPPDSDSVMAIREHTGELAWQRAVPDRVQSVVGVHAGVVVLSGRAPWGLVAASGDLAWGGPRYSPVNFGYGSAAVSGSTLLFPTRERIEVRDVRTGNAVRQSLSIAGGNLKSHGNMVTVSTANSLKLLVAQ